MASGKELNRSCRKLGNIGYLRNFGFFFRVFFFRDFDFEYWVKI